MIKSTLLAAGASPRHGLTNREERTMESIPASKAGQGAAWFFRTAWTIIRRPSAFFRSLPPEAGFREPLLFLGMALLLDALLTLILAKLDWQVPATPGLSRNAETAVGYLSLPLAPFILFGMARLFGGRGRLVHAVQVIAYSGAVMVIPSISYAGYVVGFYGLLLMYLGAKERFQLSVRRAVFMFLAFAVLFSLVQMLLLSAISRLPFLRTASG